MGVKHTHKHCSICEGVDHNTSNHRLYEVKPKIKARDFPITDRDYPKAHRKADEVEKKTYPSGYEKMKKIDRELPKDELAGKNTKSGKIEVSSKVPSKFRKEVALHEKVENKDLKKRK